MHNDGLVKAFVATTAVGQYLLVRATSGGAGLATAATDPLIGVCDSPKGAAQGEAMDVVLSDIAQVRYGGTVAAGDLLTSDAQGRAIATTTAGQRVVGIALVAGAVDDIGSVLLNQGAV